MKRSLPLLPCCLVILLLIGCAAKKPPTFIEQTDPGWKVIDLRDGLRYEEAWQMLVDRIRKHFDIEIMDKDSGYLRTSWSFTTAGAPTPDYKHRVTIKFAPDKRQLELKIDAMYQWFPGTDTQVTNDVYGDISGLLSRVRR